MQTALSRSLDRSVIWLIAIEIVVVGNRSANRRVLLARRRKRRGPMSAGRSIRAPFTFSGPARACANLPANFGETAPASRRAERELEGRHRDAGGNAARDSSPREKQSSDRDQPAQSPGQGGGQGRDAKRAFGEIQTRVRAFALVHRYLYESDDLKSVNLGAFLKELAASLQLSYGVSEEQVAIEVEAEAVWDISDRAVPLALFMTEAMTNALKHAFPQGRRGRIRIVLKSLPDGVVRFSVEDNGVGLTEAQMAAQGRQASLGMSLIKAFARQVEGTLTISGPPGTVVAIEFINKVRPPAGDSSTAAEG